MFSYFLQEKKNGGGGRKESVHLMFCFECGKDQVVISYLPTSGFPFKKKKGGEQSAQASRSRVVTRFPEEQRWFPFGVEGNWPTLRKLWMTSVLSVTSPL